MTLTAVITAKSSSTIAKQKSKSKYCWLLNTVVSYLYQKTSNWSSKTCLHLWNGCREPTAPIAGDAPVYNEIENKQILQYLRIADLQLNHKNAHLTKWFVLQYSVSVKSRCQSNMLLLFSISQTSSYTYKPFFTFPVGFKCKWNETMESTYHVMGVDKIFQIE